MERWSRATTYVAVVLIAAGFVLMVLAWNGAAEQNCVDCQIPYVLSGGLPGLGLVVAGVALAVVQELRKQNQATMGRLDRLADSMDAVGHAARSPSAVPEDGEIKVVAGRTTFHTAECHLVEGRGDLQVMSPGSARDRGLAPCRICEPQGTEVSA